VHNLPTLADLLLLDVVQRSGSLARAATELGLSPSAVSKRITTLEAQLGLRLLNRSTRRVTLTEHGGTVHRWARRILAMNDDMVEELSQLDGAPRGTLRVSTSSGFGRRHIAPVISTYASRFPDVDVRLEVLDRAVDPAAEGIDVDVRVGGIQEPHLFARRLAANHRLLCAAPDYLRQHGRPTKLAELAVHRCLIIRERDQPYGSWRLEGPDGEETARVRGSLSTNFGEIAHQWALDGHGIILRSHWDVADSLTAGRLEQVLPRYHQQADVWAVYPMRLSDSPKLAAFINLLADHLASLCLIESVKGGQAPVLRLQP
jgi:LysR family transcriptional activator of dmlA